jgi:heme/copper-type cytochrome/quinol oxidase subunit 2
MSPARTLMPVLLFAAGGSALPTDHAQASVMTTPQMESVQAISWTIEFLAIFIALVIAVLIWRLSKRDHQNRNAKRDEMTRD